MTAPTRSPRDWDEFAQIVASVSSVEARQITRSTLLIDELGLDSLALVELIVELVETYGVPSLLDTLDSRDWLATTAGDLFDETHRPTPASRS